jgi:hypothetical protein
MAHRISQQLVQSLQPLAAVAALACAPLLAQAQTPPTQLWVDLSTSTMTGMPEFMQGGVGGVISGLFGGKGGGGSQVYGHASGRFIQQGSQPGLSGAFPPNRVIDLALYNPRKPGAEAALFIPLTMGMGEQLPLVPPSPSFKEAGEAPAEMPEIKGRILIYWGCGEAVRAGQPKVINLSNNPAVWAGALAGRMVPERAARVGAQHALYPNEKNTVNPKADTSLQGVHQVRGDGVPESMQFTLAERQDLMPAIQLQQQGDPSQSIRLSWQPVARAAAYHLHAMGAAGQDMVLWSSSDNGDAGLGLFDYLTEGTAAKWVKEKVLLSPETTQCAVPKGIFAGGQGGGGRDEMGGAMLRMIAYGPESHFSHPVRPPKAPGNWQPEWSVRVRAKSQTMAMLGLDMSGMAGGRESAPAAQEEKPSGLPGAAGSILRGIFGR